MIKKIRIRTNLILGVLIGFILSQVVIMEGYAIIAAIQQQNNFETVIQNNESTIFKVLAIIVFISTIIIFNTKKLKNISLNKISVYLISSVVIAAVIAIETIMIIFITCLRLFPNLQYYFMNDYFISINMVYLLILLGIIIFIIISVMFINRKVKYIKLLTREVKVIKDEGFGRTIEVKGNDELAELCKSINSMSLELREKIDNEKKVEQNKNELITNVSHDLRTPLTSIIGYIDLLKKNEFEDREKFDDYIKVIDERAKSLNKLINELFEYTKLNSHDIKLNYSNVDIGQLLDQIIGEYVVVFNREGLELEKDITEKDIFINIDIEKIVRVLENLLTNAQKYSMKNSKVSIQLFEEDDNVVILVSNEAENISEDDLEHIFERFYKIDKSRRDLDSSGLGLNIVKRIVELHNGIVKVELNGKLITFKVILPRNI